MQQNNTSFGEALAAMLGGVPVRNISSPSLVPPEPNCVGVGEARHRYGDLAAEAGQLQLNVMEPGLAQSMFESINLLTHACDTLRTKCVTGITANVEVCRNNVFNSIGIITYFNEIIGHQAGDLVGKECARTGKSVREVLIEKGLMTPGEIDKILTTDNFLNPSYSGAYYGRDDKGLPDLSE